MVRPRNHRDPNGFYRCLGVSPSCSQSEIKKAYRRLSKRYHPDGSEPDREKFDQTQQAYRVLTQNREWYDSLPRGSMMSFDGSGTPLPPPKSLPSLFSFFYDDEPNCELAQRWYRELVPSLVQSRFRGRVTLLLSNRLGYVGGLFIVPHTNPTPSSIFLLTIQSFS